jgi:hypothetical protein
VAFAESGLFLDLAQFCDRCGAAVYRNCPDCCAPFPSGVLTFAQFAYPRAFCRRCGEPFPWATREDLVARIENILAEDRHLAEGDRRLLAGQLEPLRRSPDDDALHRQQLRALERLRAAAPKQWGVILPAVMPILTSDLKRALGLPAED